MFLGFFLALNKEARLPGGSLTTEQPAFMVRHISHQIRQSGWVVLVPVLFFLSCNQPFDPRGPYTEKLVVFSVLSNDRSIQYVRVNTTYNPADFDPLTNTIENQVTDAQVSLSTGGKAYPLRDTLLTRPDTGRYATKLHAYVAAPFQVTPGTTYNLLVQSPTLGTARSSLTLPLHATLSSISANSILDEPLSFGRKAEITFRGTLSNMAVGYVYHLYIDYDISTGNGWFSRRTEIPFDYRDSVVSVGVSVPVGSTFPAFTRIQFRSRDFTFLNGAYLATLLKLVNEAPSTKFVFKRVVFLVLQAEQNFYNYYNVVNGFRDPHSVRDDEPAYWNIDGGYGLFGGYTTDSLVHVLPADFRFNRQ